MNFLKWVSGRQKTGYKKLKLFQFWRMDCYLLKYEVGDFIPWHIDPVPNHKHFRLNIVLRKAKRGGILAYKLSNEAMDFELIKNRITLFRSDLIEHSVSEIEEGRRIVLTFGLAL